MLRSTGTRPLSAPSCWPGSGGTGAARPLLKCHVSAACPPLVDCRVQSHGDCPTQSSKLDIRVQSEKIHRVVLPLQCRQASEIRPVVAVYSPGVVVQIHVVTLREGH